MCDVYFTVLSAAINIFFRFLYFFFLLNTDGTEICTICSATLHRKPRARWRFVSSVLSSVILPAETALVSIYCIFLFVVYLIGK